jgi:hypothetical protein
MAAEKNFPNLKETIEKIRLHFSADLASGRYGFAKFLERIYRLILKWREDGKLKARLKTVSELFAIVPRNDANRFSVLVKICTNRDRRTISRWSLMLDNALRQRIPADEFISFVSPS